VSSAECAPVLHRSYLYVPGSDPRRIAKALAAGADAVVLDLEDAVAPAAKADARNAVTIALLEDAVEAPCDLHVRIDRESDGTYRQADLEAAAHPGLAAIRLPKVEDPEHIRDLDARLSELELERGLPVGAVGLYPTFESAAGLVRVTELLTASPRTVRAAIGTSDLLSDLMASGDDDLATLHVRSELVLRSRAAGVGPPIDSVHTHLEDEAGLVRGARRARSLGFFGKSVIHPRQLNPVHRVFTPTEQEIAHAERVIAVAGEAASTGTGGVDLDGEFVDAAVVRRARAVLAMRRKGST
jgi:citrate lyase subunit beta / citryl-CoA lyase